MDLTSTDGLALPLPLVVANMTAISGRRMAETVARRGGMAIIPQDLSIPVATKLIERVKAAHTVFDTPIHLAPEQTTGESLNLIAKRAHGVAVVMDGNTPVGVVTQSDLESVDRFVQAHEIMTKDMLTVSPDASPIDIFETLNERRQRFAIAVDDAGELVGIITMKGAMRSALYKPAVDADNRLRVGVAVGISGDVAGRARAMLDAGVDALVIDTAHGHQERMLDSLSILAVSDAHPGKRCRSWPGTWSPSRAPAT